MLDETPFVTNLRVGDYTLRTGATLPRSPYTDLDWHKSGLGYSAQVPGRHGILNARRTPPTIYGRSAALFNVSCSTLYRALAGQRF